MQLIAHYISQPKYSGLGGMLRLSEAYQSKSIT